MRRLLSALALLPACAGATSAEAPGTVPTSTAQPPRPAATTKPVLAASFGFFNEQEQLASCIELQITPNDGDDGAGLLDAFLAQLLQGEDKGARIKGGCSSLRGTTPRASCANVHLFQQVVGTRDPTARRLKDVLATWMYYDAHDLLNDEEMRKCIRLHGDWRTIR
jgi:hypothetical protein